MEKHASLVSFRRACVVSCRGRLTCGGFRAHHSQAGRGTHLFLLDENGGVGIGRQHCVFQRNENEMVVVEQRDTRTDRCCLTPPHTHAVHPSTLLQRGAAPTPRHRQAHPIPSIHSLTNIHTLLLRRQPKLGSGKPTLSYTLPPSIDSSIHTPCSSGGRPNLARAGSTMPHTCGEGVTIMCVCVCVCV